MNTFIDIGSSTPVDHIESTALPIPISVPPAFGLKLAEFGLSVQAGTVSNFVELKGTIGVHNTGFPQGLGQEIILTITRRLALLGALEESIATVEETVHPGDFGNITITHTDGGVGSSIPAGYYGYAIYIQRRLPPFEESEVIVSGPILFGGSSYVKNN